VWVGDRLVGSVTSGAYGHHVGLSLALAYLDHDVIDANGELTVFVVGEPRGARILPELPYDPAGAKLRA
jgi:dimethylglycine dehydrogenase